MDSFEWEISKLALANYPARTELTDEKSQPLHIVIKWLFLSARNQVDILTRSLPENPFGAKDVTDAATAFLVNEGYKDTKMRILFRRPPHTDFRRHPLFVALNNYGHVEKERVLCRVLPLEMEPSSFIVTETSSYCIVPPPDSPEPSSAGFSHCVGGHPLMDRYDHLWGLARPLSVPYHS